MPHVDETVSETVRAPDELKADEVIVLANHGGTYLGKDGQDELLKALDTHTGGFHPPRRSVLPDGSRHPAVRHRLSARHVALSGYTGGGHWKRSPIASHVANQLIVTAERLSAHVKRRTT
jgi:hypothetical protein